MNARKSLFQPCFSSLFWAGPPEADGGGAITAPFAAQDLTAVVSEIGTARRSWARSLLRRAIDILGSVGAVSWFNGFFRRGLRTAPRLFRKAVAGCKGHNSLILSEPHTDVGDRRAQRCMRGDYFLMTAVLVASLGLAARSCPTTWATRTSAATAARSRRPTSTRWPPAGCASRSSTTPRAAARRAPRLLTGLYPHQAGVGHMMDDRGYDGYRGDLNRRCVTIAEALRPAGYRTYMSGKWHVTKRRSSPDGRQAQLAAAARLRPLLRHHPRRRQLLRPEHADAATTRSSSPCARSGVPAGDVLLHRRDQRQRGALHRASTTSAAADKPFFLYVAYTAAHWPMHALAEGHRQVQGQVRRRLRADPRRRASEAHEAAGPDRPERRATVAAGRRLGRGPRTRRGKRAAWRSTPRWSTAWTRASAASSPR